MLDANLRWDMTEEEALALGRKAIMHATHRDAYSGGNINRNYVFSDVMAQFDALIFECTT